VGGSGGFLARPVEAELGAAPLLVLVNPVLVNPANPGTPLTVTATVGTAGGVARYNLKNGFCDFFCLGLKLSWH
jgi:hypothetical protein